MYICIYVYMCICIYIYVYVCVCVYVYMYICINQGWIWVPLATAEARTPGSVPCLTHAHSTPTYTLPNAGCYAPQRQHNVMGKHNCCRALGKGGGRMHRHPLQDRK